MTTDGRYEYERTTRHRVTNNNSAEKAMRRMKTDDIFEDERAMCSLIFVNLRRALHLPIQGRQCEILNHGDSRLQQGQGPQKHSCMATPSFNKGKARRNIAATRPGAAYLHQLNSRASYVIFHRECDVAENDNNRVGPVRLVPASASLHVV